MPDDLGQGAGVGADVSTPSDSQSSGTGVGEGSTGSGTDTSIDYSTVSDADILGVPLEDLPSDLEGGEGTPDSAVATPSLDGKGIEGAAPPPWLKALYADQKIGPQAQALWDQTAAFRSLFPTVAEAKTVKDTIDEAGGVESLRDRLALADHTDQTDAAFFSGDKGQQAPIIAEMFEEDRDAFESGVLVSLDVIRQQDPARYEKMTGEVLGNILGQESFAPHLEHMRAALDNPQGLRMLVGELLAWADTKGLSGRPKADPKLNPEFQRLEGERQRLQQEQQGFQQERYEGWKNGTDTQVRTKVDGVIAAELTRILPKVSEGMRGRIARDVASEVDRIMREDQNLQRRVQQVVLPMPKQWNLTSDSQSRVSNLLIQRATSVLPTAVKKVVGEFTKDFISRNQQTNQKIRASASRPDITGGSPSGTGRKPPLTKEKAAGMSDADILNY